jgi:hypothetical protein
MTDPARDELPDPLVPEEVDLRDFPTMPLDTLRLLDSEFIAASTPKNFKAAVMLWCHSWHQVPASSVPNSAQWLRIHSGLGRDWPRAKQQVLYGFILCSDGRYYHPVIAEMALQSFSKRKGASQKAKTAATSRWMLEALHKQSLSNAQAMLGDAKRSEANRSKQAAIGAPVDNSPAAASLPPLDGSNSNPKTDPVLLARELEKHDIGTTGKNRPIVIAWSEDNYGLIDILAAAGIAHDRYPDRNSFPATFLDTILRDSANSTDLRKHRAALTAKICARCGRDMHNGSRTKLTGGDVCTDCYESYKRNEWIPQALKQGRGERTA